MLLTCFFLADFASRRELYAGTGDELRRFHPNLVAASHSPRVAWVFDAKGVRNIWVADAPDFAARQITHYDGDDGLPIASLRITADGRTLVYVRGSETNESGRVADPTNGIWPRKQQVWAIDVEAGAPRLLGEMGCAEEDCEDVQLSPDGQFAVGRRASNCGLRRFRERRPPTSSPICAATIRIRDGLPMDARLRWSALAAITASSLFTISDAKQVRYLSPSADRDGMPRWSRMAGALLSSGSREFRRRCR